MKKSVQLLMVILFFIAFLIGHSVNAFSQRYADLVWHAQKATDTCVDCHQKNKDEVMVLFAQSTHARRQLSCENCHGGDNTAKEKAAAHKGNFLGKPTGAQILGLCSACHQSQFAVFKTGKHIREDGKSPRVDCVQCHGAHLIGSSTPTSEFALLCTNCHGLEYIPELPTSLRNILAADDEVKNALNEWQLSGRKPSESVVGKRRELRQTIAGIVHSTNSSQAKAQEQKILELSNVLKQQIHSENK